MKQAIENLIQFEIAHHVITERDYIYVKNQLYYLLDIEPSNEVITPQPINHPSEALAIILDGLEQQNKLTQMNMTRDLFDCKIMNIFASLPSHIEARFYALKGEKRTNYLYRYAQALNYIRVDRILKNKSFTYDSTFGPLQITINLSKPEKDPKAIANALNMQHHDYPTCVLCKENEGFSGHLLRDARDQHRLLRFELDHEFWYFQYSPYIYYNEHAIVLSDHHRPMHIDDKTFKNLLTLTDMFTGYFFGSNADLPIVGGSILTHDHYQGGKHPFPIEHAEVLYTYETNNVSVQMIKWPLSTIRLQSRNIDDIVNLSDRFLTHWKNYSNKALNIIHHTNNTPHHTITPIARKKDSTYTLDLVLRDNRTSDQHPLGIFHPHEDKWHIKKENIGLIEAMGLAILPKRLVDEFAEIKDYIINQKPLSNKASIHQPWIDTIKHTFDLNHLDQSLNQAVGKVFEDVLLDCGVFKHNDEGINAFDQFIKEVLA